MIKVYGRPNSSNVQKVMWCVGELGLGHEHVPLGGSFGGLDTSHVATLNPFRKVPILEEEDGYALFESNTIVRYLTAKHSPGRMMPAGPKDRAHAERWMDWELGTLSKAIWPCFLQTARWKPEDRDKDAVEASRQKTIALLQVFDQHLEGRDFIMGDQITCADMTPGIHVHRWFAIDIARPDLKNVRAWYDRLLERAPYREHVADQPL